MEIKFIVDVTNIAPNIKEISASPITKDVSYSIQEDSSKQASLVIDRADSIKTDILIESLNKVLNIDMSYINRDVSIEAISIIEIKVANFIKVDKDVIWVTPEIWEQLMVMSNVEWTII